jgi:hypothetical protein
LKKLKTEFVHDLLNLKKDNLAIENGIGIKTIDEIINIADKYGIKIK